MELRISKSTKEKQIPKDANIMNQEVSAKVEEIENGFLLIKSFDVTYTLPSNPSEREYAYFTKKWFHKQNPLQIDKKKTSKELAELL